MLAQNFKSAADLGITEPQFDALRKTLVLLETDKLIHIPRLGYCPVADGEDFTGHFNMSGWRAKHQCGTCACIGGTAELVGKVSFGEEHYNLPPNLYRLFYPFMDDETWGDITPTQAATALRSYLTTGDARWDLAVA